MPRRREFDRAILLKLTEDKIAEIERAAVEVGMTRSAYIRAAVDLSLSRLAQSHRPGYVKPVTIPAQAPSHAPALKPAGDAVLEPPPSHRSPPVPSSEEVDF